MRIVTFERPELHDTRGRRQGSLGAAALGFDTLSGVRHGAERIGAVLGSGPLAGSIVDLNRALAVQLAIQDAGAPEAQADSLLPAETQRFMRRWSSAYDAARASLAFVAQASESFDAPDLEAAGVIVRPQDLRHQAPVPRPTTMLVALGEEPPFDFLPIAGSSLVGPEGETRLPADLSVAACGAIAVVISHPAHRVGAEDALDHIAGYCASISFVGAPLRDQALSPGLGRSCDSFTVLGSWLVTRDDVPEPGDVLVRTRCSGELVESSRAKWDRPLLGSLLAEASQRVTLAPGDLLLIPIPGHRTRNLHDGDLVEVEVERIGRLVRYVRNEPQTGDGF